MRVLFIEDDQTDRLLLQRYLEREGFRHEAEVVTSLQEASEALQQRQFDVIVSDYRLRDGTGFEVFHLANKTPVIFMTGAGSEEIAVQAIKSGAYEYVVKDDQGMHLRMLPIILEGVRKRRRTEEALRQAEQRAHDLELENERARLLSEFITSISHDMRTPLTIVHTSLELLKLYSQKLRTQLQQAGHYEAYRAVIDKMYDYSEKMLTWEKYIERMVNRMIEVVKLSNTTQFQFSTEDITPLLRDITTGYQDRAALKQQRLVFECAADFLPVAIVPDNFTSILTNLLDNACQYTPDGGQITVRLYSQEQRVILEVADTGIGIAEEALPLIFERFYRVDQARQMNSGGNGLGLTIVKRVVEVHGGTIEVTSKPDEGSTFRVLLPLASSGQPAPATE